MLHLGTFVRPASRRAIISSVLLAIAFLPVTAVAQDSSVFVYADAGEPTTLDPARTNTNYEFTVTRSVYDRLINYDLDDPSSLQPGLAVEWTQDGNAWIVKLREGVKFHDGTSFDAEDVKATLDRLLKLKLGQSYLVSEITGVTVIDPATVRIETAQPNVFLPANLSKIEMLSSDDIAAHGGEGDTFFAEGGNGTGPYKLVNWKRGVQIELERNTDWWDKFSDKPFDRIVDRFVEDGANRARGVEGGEFDMANFIPLDDAIRIAAQPGFKLIEGNNLWAWPAIYLNTQKAPTDNADFRKALVKAFDYQAMLDFSHGKATTPRGPIPDWFPLSPEAQEPEIVTNLDEASAALEKSGIQNATMSCSIPAGFPEFRFAATILQASAAQLGVTVEVDERPTVEALKAIKNNETNCFAIGNANLSPADATKFFAAHYSRIGHYNAAKLDLPELEKIIADMPTVTQQSERAAQLKRAFELIVDSNAIIWTARPKTLVIQPDRITGYRVDPAEYINIRFWEIGQAK
ncbi:ABC transporter substrate-binding protein [Brucella abortus]|uniref:ABC transporter substrate-binding protein n=1 Tax=Brucella abortus TaxID=235 RepID=UPI00403F9386